MAKLYFKYGAMGSSKTAQALMTVYNYEEKGQKALLLKPEMENRDGENIVRSRIGLQAECKTVEDFIKKVEEQEENVVIPYSAIIVDEAQFLEEEQVDFFAKIVDQYGIPVICFGLRTDFQTRFFPGSKRLMEIADSIEEIKTICWCGKKATINTRIDDDGNIVRSGAQVVLGGNDRYTTLCRKHYYEGKIKKYN